MLQRAQRTRSSERTAKLLNTSCSCSRRTTRTGEFACAAAKSITFRLNLKQNQTSATVYSLILLLWSHHGWLECRVKYFQECDVCFQSQISIPHSDYAIQFDSSLKLSIRKILLGETNIKKLSMPQLKTSENLAPIAQKSSCDIHLLVYHLYHSYISQTSVLEFILSPFNRSIIIRNLDCSFHYKKELLWNV